MSAGGPGPLWKRSGDAAPTLRRPALHRGGALGWLAVRVAAVLACAAVVVGTAGLLLQRADGGPTAAWARSTGHDALWMGQAWVDGRHGLTGMGRLVARLRGSGISDIYVLAGALDSAGRLSPAGYAGAGPFLTAIHAGLGRVRVSAWLRGAVGAGHINLADHVTRANILAAAGSALRAGFSGVNYDLQPVTSGDTGLLRLLRVTRRLAPEPLSIAAPKLEPLPGLRLPAELITRRPVFWTTGYLAEVARSVDQVAVQSYDTGMPFRSWYGGYTERETALALQAMPKRTELLMGLPAFHADGFAHHSGTETVAAAIHGIRVALTAAGRARTAGGSGSGTSRNHRFGVALFADATATPQDWAAYRQDWVRRG